MPGIWYWNESVEGGVKTTANTIDSQKLLISLNFKEMNIYCIYIFLRRNENIKFLKFTNIYFKIFLEILIDWDNIGHNFIENMRDILRHHGIYMHWIMRMINSR